MIAPHPVLGECDARFGEGVRVHLDRVAADDRDRAERGDRLGHLGAADADLDRHLDLAVAAVGEPDDPGGDPGTDLRGSDLAVLSSSAYPMDAEPVALFAVAEL